MSFPPSPGSPMHVVRFFASGAGLLLLSGCATMFGGGGRQVVRIQAEPGADYVVKTARGDFVASGKAPADVTLSRKHEYIVEFTAPGYEPASNALTRRMNGWAKVNFVFLIGGALALIPMGIDASTGARWKLEPPVVAGLLVPLPPQTPPQTPPQPERP